MPDLGTGSSVCWVEVGAAPGRGPRRGCCHTVLWRGGLTWSAVPHEGSECALWLIRGVRRDVLLTSVTHVFVCLAFVWE